MNLVWNKILDYISRLKNIKTLPLVILTMLSGFLWAVILLIPGEILERSQVYGMMTQIMSQESWAAWFFIISVLQFIRLVSLNGSSYIIQLCTIIIKLLTSATWIYVSLTCLLAKWPPVAIAIDSVIIAIASVYDLLKFNEKGIKH